MMVRVFANGLGDLGSIQGQVIPKTQKMVLDASLLNTQQYKVGIKGKVVLDASWLNTQQYKVGIKGKVEQSRKRSSALPTPWCCSSQKRSLLITLD